VRTKLGAVLTIPAVAFVSVAGVQTNASVREGKALQGFSRQVNLSRQVATLVHELQRDRDRTAGVLAAIVAHASPVDQDPAHVTAALGPEQASVDRAAVELREAARPLLADPAVRHLYDQANASLRLLDRVRGGVQGGWLRQQAAFDSYTRTISDLLALLPSPAAVGSGGEQLSQAVRAVIALAQTKELTDQIRGRLYALCINAQADDSQVQALSQLSAERQVLLHQFSSDAPAAQLAVYDAMVHGQAVRNAERLGQRAVADVRAGKVSVDAQQWWQASSAEIDLIRLVETRMLATAVSAAQDRSIGQWRDTLSATALIVVILLVALFTSWGIGRSMALSLRRLREQALDVAQHRLPEAIELIRTTPHGDPVIDVGATSVDTTDEIGEVAQAFTAVHRSAVRLAVEQAMMRRTVNSMFTNLARRSQTLVERQLQLLDDLESSETDPDQLANLFRLDHLATRMRRNDENLLVLAGADNSRRWSQPVALSTVVLAAMAEIEQYPRIRQDVAEDVYVVGYAVADVVHLLAELLENATTFSPPDCMVTVSGWRSYDGGGANVTIEDRGLGMSPNGIDDANQQLTTPSSIDVATSERMGLLVVANLAARHRIRVELASAEHGLRAHVWLPPQLLAMPPVHRATGRYGTRALSAGTPGAGPTGPQRLMRDLDAADSRGTGDELKAGPNTPVLTAPDAPAPAAGVPAITVVGNTASLGRAVARAVGAGIAARSSSAAPDPGPAKPGDTLLRRSTPPRAEDILSAASKTSSEPNRWWSRTDQTMPSKRLNTPPPQPVNAGTSSAGLPIRRPMAQLPGSNVVPAQRTGDELVRPAYEPDPSEVSSILSRFYSGVGRATAEDETGGQTLA
jgi:methyl-accepting chemotaxis protein